MFDHPIRTITLGLAEAHPLPLDTLRWASTILRAASARYAEAGYEVQTVRISTRPLLADLVGWSPGAIVKYVQDLQKMLDEVGLGFCSLGTVDVTSSGAELEQLDLIADLLIPTSALNMTVQLAAVERGLRAEAALPVARIIQRLSQETEEGFGNFRFAALACVEAGGPFFPAAYHSGPASLTIGLQGAGIVQSALQAYVARAGQTVDLEQVTARVREALVAYAAPIVTAGRALAQEYALDFGGIDLSPAPMGEDSIVSALELCGYGAFGSPGTLAVVGALTAALKSTDLPTCGYCGLMLPVMEDATLSVRWEEGLVNVHQLLLYSSVCGTGLDTIPLPGDSSAESIGHLLLDVATLALRLRKPLSARLFPVPGKQAGERTSFTSPYLTNTLVQ
jgi:uncharacterized protein (UPF0210 family)